jgi:hypothetical protein
MHFKFYEHYFTCRVETQEYHTSFPSALEKLIRTNKDYLFDASDREKSILLFLKLQILLFKYQQKFKKVFLYIEDIL